MEETKITEDKKLNYASAPVTSVTVQICSDKIRQLLDYIAKEKGIMVSFGDVVFHAICQSLGKFPIFNSSFFHGTKIYQQINVGYSLNLDQGPRIAVIKDADKKSLLEISQEIKRLALDYIHENLPLSAAEESTFLVNNLSAFNAYFVSTPLYERRSGMISISSEYDSLKVTNGQVTPVKTFNLTLSFDARVADCKQALAFLNSIKMLLESSSSQAQ